MEECLNSNEKSLLEYICTRYKNTLEVKFRIPTRDYVYLNPTKEICTLWTSEITLAEKILDYLNKKRGAENE